MEDDNPNTEFNTDLRQQNEGKFSRIELFYRSQAYRLKEQDLPFYIGRDSRSCALAIHKDVISRIHCVIELRDSQVGVLDRSTNGTVVKAGEVNSVIIRHEFYPLTGKGCLSLGEQYSLDQEDIILFKVVMESF